MRGGVEERCWEQGAARQLMMFEECNEPESNPLGAQGDAPAASCRHVSFTVRFQHAHAGAQQPAAMSVRAYSTSATGPGPPGHTAVCTRQHRQVFLAAFRADCLSQVTPPVQVLPYHLHSILRLASEEGNARQVHLRLQLQGPNPMKPGPNPITRFVQLIFPVY